MLKITFVADGRRKVEEYQTRREVDERIKEFISKFEKAAKVIYWYVEGKNEY